MKSIAAAQQAERDEILTDLWELASSFRGSLTISYLNQRQKDALREAEELLEKKKADAGIAVSVAPQLELLG